MAAAQRQELVPAPHGLRSLPRLGPVEQPPRIPRPPAPVGPHSHLRQERAQALVGPHSHLRQERARALVGPHNHLRQERARAGPPLVLALPRVHAHT